MQIECRSYRAEALPGGVLRLHIDEPQECWSIQDVADYLKKTRRTIHNLMNRSRNPLPHSRVAGRHPRFLRSEVEAWLHRDASRCMVLG